AGRKNSLFITISTAGVFDPASIPYQYYLKSKNIITGIDKSTLNHLGVIYEADPSDDWRTTNPDCVEIWKKANPSLGITMPISKFRQDVIEVERSPSATAAFERYRLNLWGSAGVDWISDDLWMRGHRDNLLEQIEEEIEDYSWYAGL